MGGNASIFRISRGSLHLLLKLWAKRSHTFDLVSAKKLTLSWFIWSTQRDNDSSYYSRQYRPSGVEAFVVFPSLNYRKLQEEENAPVLFCEMQPKETNICWLRIRWQDKVIFCAVSMSLVSWEDLTCSSGKTHCMSLQFRPVKPALDRISVNVSTEAGWW